MTALIIPAYKPTEELLRLAREFAENDGVRLVVVDDGSGEAYRDVFAALPDDAVVLRHAQNRGKGAALKTALVHVLERMPECSAAVTADADGQHACADILRVRDAALEDPAALVLGCRAFKGEVPLRSRLGNGITRWVFAAVSGRKVSDTQTGLRAFGREAMRRFLAIRGERYEYEINVLLTAAREGMRIREIAIETIYIEGNASSHFHPVRDSLKIYGCILLFACSSLMAFSIDFVLVLAFNALLRPIGAEGSLLVSVVAARLVSAGVNFTVNRRVVFRGNERLRLAAAKYALLAAGILIANYLLLRGMTLGLQWNLAPAKLLVEACLFAVSFFVQGRYVYRRMEKAT